MPKASKPPAPAKAAPKKPEPADAGREVIYPEVVVKMADGPDAVTVDVAKQLFGYEAETDKVKFGPDFLFTDRYDRKVRCLNNVSNRPFEQARADQYAQDVLERQWAGPRGNGKTVNGESMVIGKTGMTLSCQHRLAGLILAGQDWERDRPENGGPGHWSANWPEEPVMESVMVFGVDESGETTMTLDNVRPRSAADVFYSDPTYFPDKKAGERKNLCRILDYAVRLLWSRTGAKLDAYAPVRTHSESKQFIADHPRIMEFVLHIFEEDQGKKIGKFVSPGTAAGLLYLMAAADSDGEAYRAGGRTEGLLDFAKAEEAAAFWVLLASGSPDFMPVRHAIGALGDPEEGYGGGTAAEKVGILVKAWNEFAHGGAITDANIALRYTTDDDGVKHLTETPTVGGIDLGEPDEVPEADPVVTEEEVVAETAKAKAAKDAKQAAKGQPKTIKADVEKPTPPVPAKAAPNGKPTKPAKTPAQAAAERAAKDAKLRAAQGDGKSAGTPGTPKKGGK